MEYIYIYTIKAIKKFKRTGIKQKWPLYCRRYIQMHFEFKNWIFLFWQTLVPPVVTKSATWPYSVFSVRLSYCINRWWLIPLTQICIALSGTAKRRCIISSPLDKMAAISRTTLPTAFSWLKIYEFRLKFRRSLFLWVKLTITQHSFT